MFNDLTNSKDVSYILLRIITRVNFANIIEAGIGLANELSSYFSWQLENNNKNI